MLSRLFIAALWSPADLLALVGDVYCIFATFPCGIPGQVWSLIVSLTDLCPISYFKDQTSAVCGLRLNDDRDLNILSNCLLVLLFFAFVHRA